MSEPGIGSVMLAAARNQVLDKNNLNHALGALMKTPLEKAVTKVGWKVATAMGELRKGMLAWYGPDGATLHSFKFPMNPEELRDAVSPEYAAHSIPGQGRPSYQFVNGGEREISFKLHFFYRDRDRRKIRDHIRLLQSLTQRTPGVPKGASGGPPPVYLYFGDFYQGVRCLVTRVEMRAFDLFDPLLLLPLRAEVEISMVEALDTTGGVRPDVPLSRQFGGASKLARVLF
jgi:hypothetical protein